MNKKSVEPSLKIIDKIENLSFASMDFPMFGQKNVLVDIKKEHCFTLRFDSTKSIWERKQENFTIEMHEDDEIYHFENCFITKMLPLNDKLSITFEITSSKMINVKRPKNNILYRMILPLEKNESFFGYFKTYGFNYENVSSSGLLKCNNIYDFELFHVSNEEKYFLFIDCLECIELEVFKNRTFEILLSLGFLTGEFHQDECFIISSEDDFDNIYNYEYTTLRKSISAPFRIIETNPYNIFDAKVANSKRKLRSDLISEEILNNLISSCREDLYIQNSLLLILESINYPLDTRPACLSVALEGLTNSFVDKNESSMKPITDKRLSKEIINELNAVVEKYKDKISIDANRIFKKKLENINSPTNRDKLMKPFELLDLSLKKYEIMAINARNDFLHCTGKLEIGRNIKDDENEFYKIYFSTIVLTRLLYRFILKSVGYEGNIVNILKHSEDIFGVLHDEPKMISIARIESFITNDLEQS